MKKFSDITKKDSSIDFKKDKFKTLSTDIESLDDQLADQIKGTKLDGEWEIVSVMGVSSDPPADMGTNEAIVINAELGNNKVKRGDFIYITALINKAGTQVHQNQYGVLKVRVTEIYNTLLVLNQLK